MALFCVIRTNNDTGDIFPNGPFASRDDARKWAEQAAVNHELDTGDELERDSEPGQADWIVAHDSVNSEECYHEWAVYTMVEPNSDDGDLPGGDNYERTKKEWGEK